MSKNNNFNNNVFKVPPRSAPAIEKIIAITPKVLDHMQKCESMQNANDPYFQHMPKDDLNAAMRYSVKMGGEDHDIARCEIM